MRVLAAAVLAGCAVTAQAQDVLGLHALPNAGYDLGYGAPTAGLGLEAGWNPAGAPVTVHLRASVDAVFVESLPFGPVTRHPTIVVYQPDPQDASVVRYGVEVVGRWAGAPLPARPYAKVGLALEDERVRLEDGVLTYSRADAAAGLGLEAGRLYVEGTHGLGDASRRRVVVGVRL